MNYLQELEKLSAGREDGGMIHGGHIHFIQGKLSDEDGSPFLKAAIYGILENVPSVIPADLPELVEKEGWEAPQALIDTLNKLNERLILPIGGYDVIRVILAAREYEALARTMQ